MQGQGLARSMKGTRCRCPVVKTSLSVPVLAATVDNHCMPPDQPSSQSPVVGCGDACQVMPVPADVVNPYCFGADIHRDQSISNGIYEASTCMIISRERQMQFAPMPI